MQSFWDCNAVKAVFSRFVERAEDKKEQMGILGKGDQCERSQNAGRGVYEEQRERISHATNKFPTRRV